MKKLIFLSLLLLTFNTFSIHRRAYAEDYYKLFHRNMYMQKEDIAENISYLVNSLNTEFIYPLYAIAKIEDETQWLKYKYLFKAHVNLKLVEQYLQLAKRYHKLDTRFYDLPFSSINIKGIEIAKENYEKAMIYWKDALEWVEKANDTKLYFINIPEIHNWSDEAYRIKIGELNYSDIINRHVKKLEHIEQYFKNMGKK